MIIVWWILNILYGLVSFYFSWGGFVVIYERIENCPGWFQVVIWLMYSFFIGSNIFFWQHQMWGG